MRKYVVTIVLMLAVATVAQAQVVQYNFDTDGTNTGSLGAVADLALNDGAAVVGGVLSLDGVDDHGFVDAGVDVLPENGAYSASFDVTLNQAYPAFGADTIFLGLRDDATGTFDHANSHLVGLWGNRIEYHVQWSNQIDGSRNRYRARWYTADGASLNAGQTYHFETIFGADRILRLLIDGVEKASSGPVNVWESIGAPHRIYVGSDNGPGQFTAGTIDNVNIIPEPMTMGLLGLGGLLALRRKRRA